MPQKPIIEFGVIGLGRFGFSLAKTLAEAGRDVLVLDNNESKIKQIRNLVDSAFVVGTLDKENLQDAGIQNCETVIVCIGEKIDVSILTTLNVISMGVPRVISKAISYEQGSALEKMGAEVVYPESDMGIQLANKLLYSRILGTIVLSDNINITEIRITSKLSGRTVAQANLRQKFSLNIIAIEHDGKTKTDITPDLILNDNDKLVVVGKLEHVKAFDSFLNK